MLGNAVEQLVRNIFDKIDHYCSSSILGLDEYYKNEEVITSFKDKDKLISFYRRVFEYYDKNGLSKEVVKRLYSPLSLNFGQGYGITPAKIIELGGELHGDKATVTFNYDGVEVGVRDLYASMFKGLLKHQPLPEIFRPLIKTSECDTLESAFNEAKMQTLESFDKRVQLNHCSNPDVEGSAYTIVAFQFATFIDDDDLVTLSPKNLSRYHGYSKQDAAIMFKCLKILADDINPVKILKNPKNLPEIQRVLSLGINDEHIYHAWELKYIDEQFLYSGPELNTADSEVLLKELEAPLPIRNYRFWLTATSEWYAERYENKWQDLSTAAKHRHIVNMIRHNAIGYCQIWRYADENRRRDYHDKAKATILIKIMNEFPVLASACVEQLNNREYYYEPE